MIARVDLAFGLRYGARDHRFRTNGASMRSHLAAIAVLSVVAVAPSFAQATRSGKAGSAVVANPADSTLKKTILDLEAKRIGAMVHKDLATLDALLADDLTYTHSGGTTDTKASFITLI